MRPPSGAEFDRHMMAIALTMARRGLGTAAPNPSVGAVVADGTTGEVIARAVTAPGGRPHAETIALECAGELTKGRTLYVTLEPCAHFGKTPPCADTIIGAGIARVVVGVGDPDPRTAGEGIRRLRAAGISVTENLLAEAARWVTLGHILRVTEARPFVQVKIAADEEGLIPRGAGGRPAWATSPEARAAGHVLRAEADAILIGAGTVRDDDPELTCRLPGLAHRSPIRIVLAGAQPLAGGAKLLREGHGPPVWVASGRDPGLATHVEWLHVAADPMGRVLIPSLLNRLAERGITRLLVEGGPAVCRAFADASAVDEVTLFMAGGAAREPAGSERARRALRALLGDLPLETFAVRPIGTDTMWRLRRAGRSAT